MEKHVGPADAEGAEFQRIQKKYKKISQDHGAEIKSISYITRGEPTPNLYENADFSIRTIKDSIREGELKTRHMLKEIQLI